MDTGIAYSKKYMKHDLGPGHPERPARLRAIMDLMESSNLLEKIMMVEPEPATKEDIETAHDSSYIEEIKDASKSEQMLDLDTPTSKNTYKLALLAAGGTVKISKKIARGQLDNGFALVRPPGHHAKISSGGGFCYFNNIAIAARKLIREEDIENVMIFDFDSHHGNGTQDIFYSHKDVLYMSFHQDGHSLYPGTGFPREVGRGDGEGYTANVPFSPGSSDGEYAEALKRFFISISEQYDPDMILVSAGFDPHSEDPLTQLELSSEGFKLLGRTAIDQARKKCDGKILFVLEGGYAVDAAAESAGEVIKSLINPAEPKFPDKVGTANFKKVESSLSSYWEI